MTYKKLLIALASLPLLLAASTFAVAADVDCTECHDEAPVPAEHAEVDEISIESCTMCHEVAGDDPFFVTLHAKHGEELGCDFCHDDDIDARKAKLKDILGN
jgi:hypothetical protein